MSANLLETPSGEEATEDWEDGLPPDPVTIARSTTSFGSYGWRWVLFLNGRNSMTLGPRAPFWEP